MTNYLNDFDYSRLNNLPKETRYRALNVLHDKKRFIELQSQQLLSQMRTRNQRF